VIGPKELPTVLRTVGQWVTKIRRMAAEFQGQFQEAMREAEMADLKKQVDDIGSSAQNFSNFDPIGTIRKEVSSVFDEKTLTPAATEPLVSADAPPAPPSEPPAATTADASAPAAPSSSEPAAPTAAPASAEPPATPASPTETSGGRAA
jgi:sec-independent protein translocase protein TatB